LTTVKCKKNDILRDGGSWCRVVTVAVSISADPPGTSFDHAVEGFTLLEFLIKFVLEEVIVELPSLTLGSEGRLY